MAEIRKINRLPKFDYSTKGAYFFTVCTQDKKQLFWKNTSVGENCVLPIISLSDLGLSVDDEIKKLSATYLNVNIEKYVIMPNHIHMIIRINDVGRTQFSPTIARIIKQFKGAITKKVGCSIWQKSYYDRIIRNDDEYKEVWQYVDENPYYWVEDDYYESKG